ncbi:MAG: glycosyltransferase family 39 protein [Acidobacteriota bacterium]
MSDAGRTRLAAGAVFLLGAAGRSAFLAWRGPALNLDSEKYLALGHNLVAHGTLSLDTAAPFALSIRFPPLYPVFIGMLSGLGFTSVYAVAMVQALLGAFTGVLVFLLARSMVPLKWASAVGVMYALHPGAVASTSTILAESLFTALLVAAVWVLSVSVRTDRLRLTAVGALLLGLAMLCRPLVLMWPFVFCGVVLLGRARRAFAHGLVLLVVTALAIAPWSMRASRVAGHLALQDPVVVAGLFCVASHWDWEQTLFNWVAFRTHPQRSSAAGLFREGVRSIRASPGRYLASRVRAVPYLFISSFDVFTGIYQSYNRLWAGRDWLRLSIKLGLLSAFSLVPLALAMLGLLASRANTTSMLCASVWLYMLLFFLPLWVEPRYWLPAVPFLLVTGGVGANAISTRSLLTFPACAPGAPR